MSRSSSDTRPPASSRNTGWAYLESRPREFELVSVTKPRSSMCCVGWEPATMIRLLRTTWDTYRYTTHRARVAAARPSRASPGRESNLVPVQDALHVIEKGYGRGRSLR